MKKFEVRYVAGYYDGDGVSHRTLAIVILEGISLSGLADQIAHGFEIKRHGEPMWIMPGAVLEIREYAP